MIIVLAGHVDHGKTSLVKALTGVNTDNLVEEQQRGLTIELGFAYTHRQDRVLGFVDVPGHQRFIHNMVAGVSATQSALLVVAADDGPMPQTQEHLDILKVLGVQRGIIALTKIDLVADERIQAVTEQINMLCRDSFLAGAPILPISSQTGTGIGALADALYKLRADKLRFTESKNFRIAIDRAFQRRGIGQIVTGTVLSGEVRIGDELHTFPGNQTIKVRDIRIQNSPGDLARAGDRCALNVSGSAPIARGNWLTGLPSTPHHELTVDITLLESNPHPVRHGQELHVYHGTTHVQGRVALFSPAPLPPGSQARILLRLSEPLLAKRGDRLLLRDQALERTLGGGEVIANQVLNGRLREARRQQWLQAFSAATAAESLAAALLLGPVHINEFATLWDFPEALIDTLARQSNACIIDGRVIALDQLHRWKKDLLDCVSNAVKDATRGGIKANDIAAHIPTAIKDNLLSELVADKQLSVRAGYFDLPDRTVLLSQAEQALLDCIRPRLSKSQPTAMGDIAKALSLPLERLKTQLQPLLTKGVIVQISTNRYLLPDTVLTLMQQAQELDSFTVKQMRDHTGYGRNFVIEVLEYFDRCGFTRRDADQRQVVGSIEQYQARFAHHFHVT